MPKKQQLLSLDQIAQMTSFSPDGAQSADPGEQSVDSAIQRAFAPPSSAVQNLQQSVAYGTTQDPDAYAKLLDLQKRTGVAPQMAQNYQKQLQQGADANSIDYPQFVQNAPRTAGWASNPDNAAVSGVDELTRLAQIEQQRNAANSPLQAQIDDRNRVAQQGGGIMSEVRSALANIEAGFYGAFKPFINAAGVAVQNTLESPKPLMDALTGLDPDWDGLKNIWTNPRIFAIQKATDAVSNYLAGQTQQGPQERLATGQANPDYKWYGRGLLNSVEQIPGQLAAFALTGKLAAGAEGAAGVDAADAEGVAGAKGAGLEAKAVPSILGSQAAQNTYADARSKGADQQTAVLAALEAGITNYALMGEMPGVAPASSLRGAVGQWAGRSAAMGTGMAVSDNAIARSYDPDRGLFEGVPQSIATMSAFEGVGAISNIVGLASESKLRERSPEKFQEAMQAIMGDDPSLRIPAEQFDAYFQGQKMDPALVANELGSTNYNEAHLSGGEVEIPTADFISKLDPEHQQALLPDVIDPVKGMSIRQYAQHIAELNDFMANGGIEKMQADAEAMDAETSSSPAYLEVKEQLRQRYADAGETPEVAETLATKDANAFSNLARSANMKPSELLALYNPKVTVGEAPASGDAMKVEGESSPPTDPLHQQVIEDIRGVVEAAKQRGHAPQKATIAAAAPWLVDAAKDQGLDLEGYNHVIDGSAVRHVVNRHSNENVETSRGQLPISDTDFEKIPEVISSPDQVVFGTKTRGNRDQIGFIKRMEDGTTLHIEEVRTGKKELAAVSMRKYPAAKDFDAITGTLPSNARSDGGDVPIIVRHPSAYKAESQVNPGDILHQGAPASDQPRGWFRVLDDGSYEIGRTKIGDLSTFVHEPAHAYLKILGDLSKREGASQYLKTDYRKALDFLGAKDGEPLTREQQETWARANEQYLREGKAPSEGLMGVFQRVAVWLHSIYKKASDLGVELTPEIRGVFDRLYASEEGVNRASEESGPHLFKSAEEAGWTDEQFKKYAADNNMSAEQAKAYIFGRLNEAAVRDRSQEWREEERNVRQGVTDTIDAQPEYKAIRSLRKGELEDETPLTLNKDELVKQFGEDRVQALQKLHPGLYRTEGGTDAETVAEIHGFGSAEEMMMALESTPRRSAAIDEATKAYMTAKHGDIRYDGTLDDQARLALENDTRSKSLYAELQSLKAKAAKAAGQKQAMRDIQVAPIDSYRDAAHQMVESKSISDLQPTRYLDASRKYSREAFDAVRRGNAEAAADAKHKELMNHFLYREASKAQEYVGKVEAYVKRSTAKAAQQALGNAGGDYQAQANKLMFRYGMANEPAQAPEGTLAEWASDQFDSGKEPAIDPAILNEDRSANYRKIPLSELRQVHDALKNIRTLASQELRMTVQGRQVDFAEAKANMIARATESLGEKPTRVLGRNATFGEKAADFAQRGDALLMRTERLVEWLDGGKTGPWHDNLWHLAADSQGQEYALQEEVTKKIGDSLDAMTKEQRMRMNDKVTIDGIPETVTRHDLVSMALNMGNDGNLDRLGKTFMSHGWDPAAVEKIKETLTREEWTHVQNVWDMLKPLGERMKDLEQRLTGLPPVMVKNAPFEVKFADGTGMQMEGGYYPIMMDPKYSKRGAEADASQSAQNMMETGYGRATTSRGYTKARTGFGGPLLLDYEQVLTQHTAKSIKDITHREFMLSASKLLMDQEVRNTLRGTLGAGYEEKFMPWLRTIINDRNGSAVQGLGDFSRWMRALRTNMVLATIPFKVGTSLLQWTHAPRMLLSTNAGSFAQSLVNFMAHPAEMTQQIRDLSPNEMRFRGENLDRDVREALNGQPGIRKKVAQVGNISIKYTDHLLSFPLWHSVYQDALKESVDLPEKEAQYQAVQKADSAVRLGLGSASPKDLPPIMRNNDLTKFLTTFHSFHNGIYGQVRDIAHQVNGLSDIPKMTYGLALAVVVPSLVGAMVTGHGPKDDENKGLWAAKRALLFSADTMPLVRDVASAMDGDGDVKFNPLMNVLSKGTKATQEAFSDKESKDWSGIGLNYLETAGDLSGMPGTTQVMKPLHYLHQMSEGKVQNPNAWDALVGAAHK